MYAHIVSLLPSLDLGYDESSHLSQASSHGTTQYISHHELQYRPIRMVLGQNISNLGPKVTFDTQPSYGKSYRWDQDAHYDDQYDPYDHCEDQPISIVP